jgi:hypothetical protein
VSGSGLRRSRSSTESGPCSINDLRHR